MAGGNESSITASVDNLNILEMDLIWSVPTAEMLAPSMAYSNGKICAVCYDCSIFCIDAENGENYVRIEHFVPACSSPCYQSGILYVGMEDGKIHSYNSTTGDEICTYSTDGFVYSTPCYESGILYVGSNDYNVYAFDVDTSEILWKYPTNGEVYSSPCYSSGLVYVGSYDNNVSAIDASTGTIMWDFTTDDKVHSSPCYASGFIYIGSDDGNVYCLDALTGSEKWRFATAGRVSSSPCYEAGIVYVGSSDGNIYALDAITGAEKWRYSTGWNARYPCCAENTIYVGSSDHNLIALDSLTGEIKWKYPVNGDILSPCYADGIVVFGVRGLNGNTDSIFAVGNNQLMADFSAVPSDGIVPLTVQFSDLSTGNPDSWYWDFGDKKSSYLQNPAHTYTLPGIYSVNLTINRMDKSNTSEKIECIHVSNADDTIAWQNSLGGSDSEYAQSIFETNDHGYVVVGCAKSNDQDVRGNHGGGDVWVVKLNSTGSLDWELCLGGSSYDCAHSVFQTNDGGYILAGVTSSTDGDVINNNYTDAWIVKLNSSGFLEWQKCIGGSGYDCAWSIKQTLDDGYILSGYSDSTDVNGGGSHGIHDAWVVKLYSDGSLKWQRWLGGSGFDYAYDIQQTSDGGYILAADTESSDGDVSFNNGGSDFWVVKLNAEGFIDWECCLGGSGYEGLMGESSLTIQQTNDGGYIFCSHSPSSDGDVSGNHGGNDAWVVKLSSTGSIDWERCFGGSGFDSARSIYQTYDGGYILVGSTTSMDGDVSGNHGGYDAWVLKLDHSGSIIFQRCFGGSGNEHAGEIIPTIFGEYIFVGTSNSNDGDVIGNHGSYDFWIVSMGDDGNELPQQSETLLVPYIHQVYDTPTGFNGEAACSETAAVMVLAYHGRLTPDPVVCEDKWVYNGPEYSLNPPRTNSFGKYICGTYSYGGTTFSEPFTDTTQLGRTATGMGAWGWIESQVASGTARPEALIQYLGLHDCSGSFVESPTKNLAEETVRNNIDNGMPLIARTNLGDLGHYVVVTGYKETDGGLLYYVNDPYGQDPYMTTQAVQHFDQPVTYTYEDMVLGASTRGLITVQPQTTWYNFGIESVEISDGDELGTFDATIIICSETDARNVPLVVYLIDEKRKIPQKISESVIVTMNAGQTHEITISNIRNNNWAASFQVNPDQNFPETDYADNSVRVDLTEYGRDIWKDVNVDGKTYRIFVQNHDITQQTKAEEIARNIQSVINICESVPDGYQEVADPQVIAKVLKQVINDEYATQLMNDRPRYMQPDETLVVDLIQDSTLTHTLNVIDWLDLSMLSCLLSDYLNNILQIENDEDKAEVLSGIILQSLNRESDQDDMNLENGASLVLNFLDAATSVICAVCKDSGVIDSGVVSEKGLNIIFKGSKLTDYGFNCVKVGAFYNTYETQPTIENTSEYLIATHLSTVYMLQAWDDALDRYNPTEDRRILKLAIARSLEKEEKILEILQDHDGRDHEAMKNYLKPILQGSVKKGSKGGLQWLLKMGLSKPLDIFGFESLSKAVQTKLSAYFIGVKIGKLVTNFDAIKLHNGMAILSGSLATKEIEEASFYSSYGSEYLGTAALSSTKSFLQGYAADQSGSAQKAAFCGGLGSEEKSAVYYDYARILYGIGESNLQLDPVMTYASLVRKTGLSVGDCIDAKIPVSSIRVDTISNTDNGYYDAGSRHFTLNAYPITGTSRQLLFIRSTNDGYRSPSSYTINSQGSSDGIGWFRLTSTDRFFEFPLSDRKTTGTDNWMFSDDGSSSDITMNNGVFNAPKVFLDDGTASTLTFEYLPKAVGIGLVLFKNTVLIDLQNHEMLAESIQPLSGDEEITVTRTSGSGSTVPAPVLFSIEEESVDLGDNASSSGMLIRWNITGDPVEGMFVVTVISNATSIDYLFGPTLLKNGSVLFSPKETGKHSVVYQLLSPSGTVREKYTSSFEAMDAALMNESKISVIAIQSDIDVDLSADSVRITAPTDDDTGVWEIYSTFCDQNRTCISNDRSVVVPEQNGTGWYITKEYSFDRDCIVYACILHNNRIVCENAVSIDVNASSKIKSIRINESVRDMDVGIDCVIDTREDGGYTLEGLLSSPVTGMIVASEETQTLSPGTNIVSLTFPDTADRVSALNLTVSLEAEGSVLDTGSWEVIVSPRQQSEDRLQYFGIDGDELVAGENDSALICIPIAVSSTYNGDATFVSVFYPEGDPWNTMVENSHYSLMAGNATINITANKADLDSLSPDGGVILGYLRALDEMNQMLFEVWPGYLTMTNSSMHVVDNDTNTENGTMVDLSNGAALKELVEKLYPDGNSPTEFEVTLSALQDQDPAESSRIETVPIDLMPSLRYLSDSDENLDTPIQTLESVLSTTGETTSIVTQNFTIYETSYTAGPQIGPDSVLINWSMNDSVTEGFFIVCITSGTLMEYYLYGPDSIHGDEISFTAPFEGEYTIIYNLYSATTDLLDSCMSEYVLCGTGRTQEKTPVSLEIVDSNADMVTDTLVVSAPVDDTTGTWEVYSILYDETGALVSSERVVADLLTHDGTASVFWNFTGEGTYSLSASILHNNLVTGELPPEQFVLGREIKEYITGITPTEESNNLNIEVTLELEEMGNYTVEGILGFDDNGYYLWDAASLDYATGKNGVFLSYPGAFLGDSEMNLSLTLRSDKGLLQVADFQIPPMSFSKNIVYAGIEDESVIEGDNGYKQMNISIELQSLISENVTFISSFYPQNSPDDSIIVFDTYPITLGSNFINITLDKDEVWQMPNGSRIFFESITGIDQTNKTQLYHFVNSSTIIEDRDQFEDIILKPDLSVFARDLKESPTMFLITVINNGTVSAGGFNVTFESSTGGETHVYPVSVVDPSNVKSFVTELNSNGTVSVDPDDTIEEIDESNNMCSINITFSSQPVQANFTANVTTGITPLMVQFTDISTGNPNNWSWAFGDGATSIEQNPTYTYLTAGAYDVTLTVSNEYGTDTETKTGYINVTEPESPSAFFILNENLVTQTTNDTLPAGDHAGHYGYFMTIVNGGVDDGSDGDGSQGNNVLHNLSVSIESQNITTYGWPAYAGCDGNRIDWNFPESFDLNVGEELSCGVSTATSDVMDYGASLARTVNRTLFSEPGVQHLEFTVTFSDLDFVGSWGRIEYPDSDNVTACKVPYSIETDAPVQWEYGDDRDQFIFNQSMLSVGVPYHFSVDVGVNVDGDVNAECPVTYKPQITVWTVSTRDNRTLTHGTNAVVPADMLPENVVQAAVGSDNAADWELVRNNHQVGILLGVIGTPSLVGANFTANVTSGTVPLTVEFADTSTGNPTSWNWTFGDGACSTTQHPVHAYELPGTYDVCLEAFNENGGDSISRVDYMTVTAPPLEANFSTNVTSGTAPLAVQFTDESIGEPTSWFWDFGDGNTSTTEDPCHVYVSPDTYQVNLTVSDAYTESSCSGSSPISVTAPQKPDASFDANVTSGEVPLTIKFTDVSTGDITGWLWKFGDGATATGRNATHNYSGVGSFTASLTVNGPGGNDTAETGITVTAPPLEANFSTNVTSGTAPLAVQFTDESIGVPTDWFWDFGDGNTSTAEDPCHVYVSPDTYQVNLTVSDAYTESSCTGSSLISVNAPPRPDASFDANVTSGEAPLTVGFTDTSTGEITGWFWKFGDGATATGRNVTHTYSGVGCFTANLTVNGLGGNDTAGTEITVTAPPLEANFSTNVTSGTAPLAVQFTDESIGVPTEWFWDFGDGNTSTKEDPCHVYISPGTYQVNLTVSDAYSESSCTGSSLISVSPPPKPDASFHANVTSGEVPLTVGFTDTSTGDITGRFWKFGDGATATERNVTHTYISPGSFTASLTVSGLGGNDTAETEITVAAPPLEATFSTNVTAGMVPLAVQFTDESIGEPTGWFWDFGDGNTSTKEDPCHVYVSPGSYQVNLTVSDAYSESSCTGSSLISVNKPPKPDASFHANVTSGVAPLTVGFTDTSTGDITGRFWKFGDGATATGRNVTHTYSSPGSFTANLTVNGPGGDDTAQTTITVNPLQSSEVSFTANVTGGSSPLAVRFSDTSVPTPTSWNWSFGDGATSTEQNPVHVYTTDGTYTVTLTVNGGEDTCTWTDYIRVTSILLGDANGDGEVNQVDTLRVLKEVVGIQTTPEKDTDEFRRTDVHLNSVIDVGDAMFIAQYNVGLRDRWFALVG